MITEKSLRPLKKAKKKQIPFCVLVCGSRGNALSFTVPQFGDPTIVIYEKTAKLFEKLVELDLENENMTTLTEMDGFLRLIEATDFQPVSNDGIEWN
ncbi:MAG: hypothetical protein PHX25_03590 [Candidatus Pacebacteria bacterium]|nr:hypothetical protein [Candidatus Paceibacterota bacterium]